MSTRKTIDDYLAANSDAWDAIAKATYAYQQPNLPESHDFPSWHRTAACVKCGRTREQVRWDDLQPQCQPKPMAAVDLLAAQPLVENTAQIAQVIQQEEAKANALIERAAKEVPAILAKRPMSGETLAYLHDTHGWDIETVGAVVDVPEWAEREYDAIRAQQKTESRALTKSKLKTIEITSCKPIFGQD